MVWFERNKYRFRKCCFDFKRFQKENITFNENVSRYEVSLPFKEYHEKPFNWEIIYESLQEYNNIIKEQLKLSAVEKVPPPETNNLDQVGNIYYLPHRPVTHNQRWSCHISCTYYVWRQFKNRGTFNDWLFISMAFIIITITFRYFTFARKLNSFYCWHREGIFADFFETWT